MTQSACRYALIAFLTLSFLLCPVSTIAAVELHLAKYKVGDNPHWRSVELNDANWTAVASGLPIEDNNYWIRVKLTISAESPSEQQAIFTSILGAYEIYWNSKKLSANGTVADNKSSEIPGDINFQTPIPQNLWSPGNHVISIRISNFHAPKRLRPHYVNIKIAPHQKASVDYLRLSLLPLVILGGLLLIGGFFLLLHFRYARNHSYLLFSSLCFLIVGLLLAELYKPLFNYSYDWHIYRLYLIEILTFSICLLLPIFFIYQFKINNKKPLIYGLSAILLSVVLLVDGFDHTSIHLTHASLAFALILVCWAVFLKRPGARLALIAISTVLLLSLYFTESFQDRYFFPSFSLIIITVLVSLINQLSQVQQERNQAKLRAAQLEISLLKKSIQPHFILNTLTSIEQWIVESPTDATEFIYALAQEFQQLNAISNKQRINIEDELKLCHTHLKIMGFRHDLKFELCTKNLPQGLEVPPALIHTLIENSFTHNQYVASPTIFYVSGSIADKDQIITLKSPKTDSPSSTSVSTGTGLKYIESRLTESFGNDWNLTSELQQGYWVTTITMPKKAHANRTE